MYNHEHSMFSVLKRTIKLASPLPGAKDPYSREPRAEGPGLLSHKASAFSMGPSLLSLNCQLKFVCLEC